MQRLRKKYLLDYFDENSKTNSFVYWSQKGSCRKEAYRIRCLTRTNSKKEVKKYGEFQKKTRNKQKRGEKKGRRDWVKGKKKTRKIIKKLFHVVHNWAKSSEVIYTHEENSEDTVETQPTIKYAYESYSVNRYSEF